MKSTKFICILLAMLFFIGCTAIEDLFEKDNGEDINYELYYEKNIQEGLDALYTPNGAVALFGFWDIPFEIDSEGNAVPNEERVIYITQTEKDGENSNGSTLVVVDPTFFPVRIISDDLDAILKRTGENTFNCFIYNSTDSKWHEYRNLEFSPGRVINTQVEETKAISSGGSDEIFTVTNCLSAISLVANIGGTITAKGLGKVGPGVGILGDIVSNNSAKIGLVIGVGASLIAANPAGLVTGLTLTAAGYGFAKYDQFKKQLFCDEKSDLIIAIDDVIVVDNQSIRFSYSVSGLNARGLEYAWLKCRINNKETKDSRDVDLRAENGFFTQTVSNLDSGDYEMFLYIYSEEFPIISYSSKPKVLFSIFDLMVDNYSIKDDPTYADGYVKFETVVSLSGDIESLKNCSEFGYYIKESNDIQYFKASTSNYSNLQNSLSIEYDGFDVKDYNSFRAEATGYKIGAYVVDKDRNHITYFGEKDLTGLVYSDKPSITFTQAEITATKNLGTENDNTHYYTTYTFGCDVSGGFWIKSADYYMDGQGWTTFWDTSFFYSDENYFYDCYLDYYSNQQMYHKDYFIITLKNGKTIYSTNSLIWGGSPNSPSVYIDNATKNNMLKQSIAINPQKNLGKMHLQKIYVYSAETTIFIQESAE